MIAHDGPTPAGGVRSEAFLVDASGTPTDDPSSAVGAEIVEYGPGGEELARTYGRTDYPAIDVPTGFGDADVDGPKATWDVTVTRDGIVTPVATLDELSSVLDRAALGEVGFRETVASMMVLPVWAGMPQGLRDEIVAYLDGPSQ